MEDARETRGDIFHPQFCSEPYPTGVSLVTLQGCRRLNFVGPESSEPES
jgi:hypothetical protein